MESVRWTGASASFFGQAAGSAAAVFISASDDPPETLLRIRGELTCWVDGPAAPATAVEVGVGIALVPEGSGTTVQWLPITEANAPFLMYERFTLGYEEMVSDVIDVPGLTMFRKVIDVKAMRIIRPDVEVQIAIEQASLNGAEVINLVFSHRTLIGST